MKIATLQYKIDVLKSWQQYKDKLEKIISDAKNAECDLVLFPEYAGLEIVPPHKNDSELFAAIQSQLPTYLEFYQALSSEYQIYIQPGTIPFQIEKKTYLNRAYFFGPHSEYGFQDKLNLIEYEKNEKILVPGDSQTLFNTALGKIGIAICYDSEFPELVRNLIYAGAKLILVPSYTVSTDGFHRVRLACRARAIENQCYIAVSYVVSTVYATRDMSEETVGQAGIFTPIDVGFPEAGILAQGKNLNSTEIVMAKIDFTQLDKIREEGTVHNYKDSLSLKDNVLLNIKYL